MLQFDNLLEQMELCFISIYVKLMGEWNILTLPSFPSRLREAVENPWKILNEGIDPVQITPTLKFSQASAEKVLFLDQQHQIMDKRVNFLSLLFSFIIDEIINTPLHHWFPCDDF